MAKDKKAKGGDYEVGYGKPPKEYQFPKGKSGNPRGAPAKRTRTSIDVAGVLNEPLTVKNGGVRRKMAPFEVSVRRLVERGLKHKDLNAILVFLDLCESLRLMVPPAAEEGGGVLAAPEGVNFHEWLESVTEWVPDSSSDGEDDDND
jgi:coenzyme F420-reducing hydrogenase alpha subunit